MSILNDLPAPPTNAPGPADAPRHAAMPLASRFEFRTVRQLAGQEFFVGDYQRGYKWTRKKVRDLLGDIADFGTDDAPEKTNNFYCLQPIVVKSREHGRTYELIDGQQRVTTIYLLLSYLRGSADFAITYQTRKESPRLLRDLSSVAAGPDVALAADSIDHYYFLNAYQAIVQWFEQHGGRERFAETLTHRTRLLWYEVDSQGDNDATNSKDIFIRLNSGKIALTDAELIKALFLRANGYSASGNPEAFRLRQAEIAREWDDIEATLQTEAFWCFINRDPGKNDPPTRIGFIFELICGKPRGRDDQRQAFQYYEEALKNDPAAMEREWEKVALYFQRLREWYADRRLYHLVGFVVTRGLASVKALLDRAERCTKTGFDEHVLTIIRDEFEKYPFSELRYEQNNRELINILLLFNIQTVLESGTNTRFPFDRYKAAKWSLEHIHAQESEELTQEQELNLWLRAYRGELDKLKDMALAKTLTAQLEEWHLGGRKEAVRLDLEKRINQATNEQARRGSKVDEEPHGLGNLALLDQLTNASLNNAIFPIKRRRLFALIERRRAEGAEIFVPEATKNVFLKYYSGGDSPQLDCWDDDDRARYLEAITTTLAKLGVKEKGR